MRARLKARARLSFAPRRSDVDTIIADAWRFRRLRRRPGAV
jgi:UDP-glucose 4-epimerase